MKKVTSIYNDIGHIMLLAVEATHPTLNVENQEQMIVIHMAVKEGKSLVLGLGAQAFKNLLEMTW